MLIDKRKKKISGNKKKKDKFCAVFMGKLNFGKNIILLSIYTPA